MSFELLDHAAHLLEREPTRCMNAEMLHCRSTIDTGTSMSLRRFLEIVARHEDRFTIIPPAKPVEDGDGWSPVERSAYREVFAAVPGAVPLVMLTRRLDYVVSSPDGDATADFLSAVREVLTDLLGDVRVDAHLRGAATAGVRDLESVRQRLSR